MQDLSEGALDSIYCFQHKEMSGIRQAVKKDVLVTYWLYCGHTFVVDLNAPDWDIDANQPVDLK